MEEQSRTGPGFKLYYALFVAAGLLALAALLGPLHLPSVLACYVAAVAAAWYQLAASGAETEILERTAEGRRPTQIGGPRR